ncbi:MAG: radical SAM protein [Candidatus Omnitrophica bacterium]|nr:radical SAM protein [Candidatus Omnitrophota bacterium]
MKYKKVLLVQAKYDSTFSNVLPAGIGYLSEFLNSKGVDNDVFDLNVPRNTEEMLLEKIGHFRPDIVGFSMMSLNYKYNYAMMKRVREDFPDMKIAAGGAHVSTMRNDVLKECGAIDYGCVLEGEWTLLELVSGEKEISEIKGLIHRTSEGVIYNGDRPFIEDLDKLPFPRYEKFNRKDYSSLISLFSSRGCPFECTYCPVKLAIGRRFVARSPESVVDELQYHYDRGSREFSFRDDNFTLIKERVYGVCDDIEKRGLKGLYLMCDNGVRADKIDHDLLKRMKEVGFRMIGLGVESGDDRVLKSLKKSSTVRAMEGAIKTACDLGYIVELYFLIGAPGETWQDFEKSVELAIRYPVLIASFYHLLPYPNTELFDFAKSNNYLLRSHEEYLNDGSQRRNTPFLSTPEFPTEMRKKAFDYAYSRTSEHVRRARIEYSKRNMCAKLKDKGLNGALASFIAGIYASNFSNSKLTMGLKKSLKKYLSARIRN